MDNQGIIDFSPATKKNPTPKVISLNLKSNQILNWQQTHSSVNQDSQNNGNQNTKINSSDPSNSANKDSFKPEILRQSLGMRSFIQIIYFPKKLLLNYLPADTEFCTLLELETALDEFLLKHRLLIKDRVLVNYKMSRDFNLKLTLTPKTCPQISRQSCNQDQEDFPVLGQTPQTGGNTHTPKTSKPLFQSGPQQFNFKHFRKLISRQKFLGTVRSHLNPGFLTTDYLKRTSIPKRGKFEKIQVLADRKRNRYHTSIRGLEPFFRDLRPVLSHLQNLLATSGSIQKIRFKKKDVECVSLQGTLADQVAKWLIEELGFDTNLVDVVFKVDQKRRNKAARFVPKTVKQI